jgi:hypothetical protein
MPTRDEPKYGLSVRSSRAGVALAVAKFAFVLEFTSQSPSCCLVISLRLARITLVAGLTNRQCSNWVLHGDHIHGLGVE